MSIGVGTCGAWAIAPDSGRLILCGRSVEHDDSGHLGYYATDGGVPALDVPKGWA